MNAWIDCLTSVDDPEDELTQRNIPFGSILVFQLDHVKDFAKRCPEIYAALVECSAFVNYRRIELGLEPVLTLSFFT